MAQVVPNVIYLSSDEDEDMIPSSARSLGPSEPRVNSNSLQPHFSPPPFYNPSPQNYDAGSSLTLSKRQRLSPPEPGGSFLQPPGPGDPNGASGRFLSDYPSSQNNTLPNDLFVPEVATSSSISNLPAVTVGAGSSTIPQASEATVNRLSTIPPTVQLTGPGPQPRPMFGSASPAPANMQVPYPSDQPASYVASTTGHPLNGTQLSPNDHSHPHNPSHLPQNSSRVIPSTEPIPTSYALLQDSSPSTFPSSRLPSLNNGGSRNHPVLDQSSNSGVNVNPQSSRPQNFTLFSEARVGGSDSFSHAAQSARLSSSLSRIPQNIEVISLDSDNEDEAQPRPASVVNIVSNESGPPSNTNAMNRSVPIPNDNDDDDDLMILDENEAANVASKFRRQTHNGPAPVPHVSDPNFRSPALIANQLQHRIDGYHRERQGLVKMALKSRTAVAPMQNMLRAATKTVANLKRQLISVPPQSTELSYSLRGLILTKEEEIRKLERNLSTTINEMVAYELLIRRIDQFLAASHFALNGTNVPMPSLNGTNVLMPSLNRQPHIPKSEPDPARELASIAEPALGYVPNVYSDDADLRNFIDSIRPDEENDELEATPAEMSINLMKHQRMGLAWLKRMESSRNKGGILADDMGLGKTVQTLALVVANRAPPQECNTTVIIAPVSLLRQWAGEAESKIKPDSALRIGIYHGADKKILNTCAKMMQFDIILTSYGTVSSEWKRHFKEALKARTEGDGPVMTFMPKPQDGGKSYISPFFAAQAKFHRIVLDEAQNIKNKSALASKAVTYMKAQFRLCLSGTPMQNKVDELFPFIRFLQIRPYHLEHKFRADISLPLKSTSGNYDDTDKHRTLNKIRALLKAILLRRLKTTLIDGKPILQLPEKHLISDYVDMDEDEKQYYDSLEQGIQMKAKKLMLEKHGPGASLNILTLLLRLRQACCHSFLVEIGLIKARLNSKDEDDEPIRLRDWRRMLESLRQLDQVAVDRIRLLGGSGSSPSTSGHQGCTSNATVENNRAPITDDTTLDDILKTDIDDEPQDPEDDGGMFTCPICYDVFSSTSSIVIFPRCGHMICDSCTDSFFESNQVDEELSNCRLARCIECQNKVKDTELIDYTLFVKVHHEKLPPQELGAFCRQYYAKAKVPSNDEIIGDLIPSGEKFKTSAKIQKCIELIQNIYTNHADEKVIIFSQFTTLFDVMKIELEQNQIDYMRFDGTMSLDQKNETIKNFYQKDIKVLLLSLRAGNTGLTLTCASHVIIMDPFWNPFVEEQAMDRAHRIGQERQVYVHRILISGTVESRIMELQDSKKELVNAALDETGMKNVSRLGQRELGFLFGLNSLR